MKTNRALQIKHPDFTRNVYDVPEGTPVRRIEQGLHSPEGWHPMYVVGNPRALGVNSHDAAHYYMTVPDDAVTE